MLPNSLGPVIVQATLTLATAILDAAALSFLGPRRRRPRPGRVGADARRRPRPTSTCGRRSRSTRRSAIIMVALGFTLLGESLREALDPKGAAVMPTLSKGGRRCSRSTTCRSPSSAAGEPADRSPSTGCSFDVERRPGRRPGRRVRLRQVGHLAGDHGAAARARGAGRAARCRCDGTDLLDAVRRRRCATRRGRDLAMVFQDPLSSLNPVIPIGLQVTEVLRRHRGMDKARRRDGGRASCWTGSASPTRGAGSDLPAPALRRHAAAGADRDRAGLPARGC